MRLKTDLLKKTSHVLVGKVASGFLGFLTYALIAKGLDIHGLGVYTFLIGLAAIVSSISSLGTNEYLFRQGAANPENLTQTLKISNFAKVIAGLITGLATTAFILLTDHSSPSVWLIVAALGIYQIDIQSFAYLNAFRSLGKTKFEALFLTSRSVLRFLAVFILYSSSKFELLNILLAFVGINILGLLICRFSYRDQRISEKKFTPTFSMALKIAKAALPFAVFGFLGNFYWQISPVMLGLLTSDYEVGLFGVGHQILHLSLFLPMSFYIALQPKLVLWYKKDEALWRKRSLSLMLKMGALATILGLLAILIVPDLSIWVFGEKYAPSTNIIRWLMVTFIIQFVWINILLNNMIATNNTRLLNKLLALKILLLMTANFIVIPTLGAVGVAQAILGVEIVVFMVALKWFYSFKSNRD